MLEHRFTGPNGGARCFRFSLFSTRSFTLYSRATRRLRVSQHAAVPADARNTARRDVQGVASAGRMAEPLSDAGLRRVQRPASTSVRKLSTLRLNVSGSSRLMACPDFGMTTSPAVGILRFM